MARQLKRHIEQKEAEAARKQALPTALYIRVSTITQADEGYSLEDQQGRLEAYCRSQDWPTSPEHIYIDPGVSGKTMDRPKVKEMIEAARRGEIGRIVVMKLDRIARNVREFLAVVDQLRVWDCELVLVKESFDTSTPHGRFALTMFAAMAELESSTISERVMAGKTTKAKSGGFNGGKPPYGYRRSESGFEIIPEEANVVGIIFTRFVGGDSLSGIARHLSRQGILTKMGKSEWSATTISQIVANGAYCGLVQYGNDIEVDSSIYPPIIDRETYNAADERLNNMRRGNPALVKTIE